MAEPNVTNGNSSQAVSTSLPLEEHARLFLGRSGHLDVMAEFLCRGINVAIPEVDIGDDIFVVKSQDDRVTRVQVKSATGSAQKDGSYFAQFHLPWLQLMHEDPRVLIYVLAVRFQNRWSDFLVIPRLVLKTLHSDEDVGSVLRDDLGRERALNLCLVITEADIRNKGISFQTFREAFEPWPPP